MLSFLILRFLRFDLHLNQEYVNVLMFVNFRFFQFYSFQNEALQVKQVFLNSQFSKNKQKKIHRSIHRNKQTLIRLSPNSRTRKLTNNERFSTVRI